MFSVTFRRILDFLAHHRFHRNSHKNSHEARISSRTGAFPARLFSCPYLFEMMELMEMMNSGELLHGIPDGLPCPSYTLRVAVRVFLQEDGFGVSQPVRCAFDIRPGGQRQGGGRVAEKMRVEVFDAVSLPKLLEVSGRRLRVHGVGGAILCEYPL